MIRYPTYILVVLLFLFIASFCFAETEIIQTGIASPQSESEKNNLEKLRERAIRNAMDLAVMQVTGATISSERGDSIRYRDEISIHNDQVKKQSKQESRFRSGATSRSEGHARLLEIIREWQKDGQYFVEAKIAVESQDETTKQKNCGDYWLQAGKPGISISFVEEFNGEQSVDHKAHTLLFFRDNLTRNGVMISTGENTASQYQIKILQSLQSNELTNLGTITMHCRLSFQIIDNLRQEVVTEYRSSHGPQAGFTIEQAKESCIKAIAQDVSENLVRSLGNIMIERWNNGVEQRLIITGMPGEIVTIVSETLQNLYRVTSATPAKYTNGQYTRTIKFKGSATELAQVIQSSFEDENWVITVSRIENGQIYLNWITSN